VRAGIVTVVLVPYHPLDRGNSAADVVVATVYANVAAPLMMVLMSVHMLLLILVMLLGMSMISKWRERRERGKIDIWRKPQLKR
jgi:trehalose utilization protein